MPTVTAITITVYGAECVAQARQLSIEDRAQIAHEIGAIARAAAPVLTGRFQAGIGVQVDGTQVEVVDNDPTAGYKEYGTSHTPAHATLTSAAAQFGRYSGVKPRGGGRAGVGSHVARHGSSRPSHPRRQVVR
jgi:hypothetical protein